MLDYKQKFCTTDIYEYNVSIGKKMGSSLRVTTFTALRKPGFELAEPSNINYVSKCSKNDFKLSTNISRARSKVHEYAACNDWEYFCTFTISKEKCNRYDLKEFYNSFSKFINNYNERRLPAGMKVSYLLIPEKHEDGAWHLHGFVSGINPDDIYTNQNGYLVWKQYDEKFGYISMDKIRDLDRCANYILKYVTKNLDKSVKDQECHLYYCSKGLKRAEVIFKEVNMDLGMPYDYESEDGLIKIKTFYNFFNKEGKNEIN